MKYLGVVFFVFILLIQGIVATLQDASVTPASFTAGKSTSLVVVFTTSNDIAINSKIRISLPTGFTIATDTTITVPNKYTTTLAISAVTTTQIDCIVQTSQIQSGNTFDFTIDTVQNPAAGTTGTFTISTLNNLNQIQHQAANLGPYQVVSSVFTAVTVVPDSLNAGVTGKAYITFTTAVELAIGSIVQITFPTDFDVASKVLSNEVAIDSTSKLSVPTINVVEIELASAITADTAVSFSVDGITNPGASTTGVFSIATTDKDGNVFQTNTNLAGVVIVSTTLNLATIGATSLFAGVRTSFTVDITTGVDIPTGGYVMITFPTDYSVTGSIQLKDATTNTVVSTGVINGQKVQFQLGDSLAKGQHSWNIDSLKNPGAKTTGTFSIVTADDTKLTLETANDLHGIEITPGIINSGIWSNPGLSLSATVSFSSSGEISVGDMIMITLPAIDYIMANEPSITFVKPVGVTGTASWNQNSGVLQIVITGAKSIPETSSVTVDIGNVASILVDDKSSASIQTWTSGQLKLDDVSELTLLAVDSVKRLPCTWSTAVPNPGVESLVTLEFELNGAIPAQGTIVLTLPAEDFTFPAAPKITLLSPTIAGFSATGAWNTNTNKLTITLGQNARIESSTILKLSLESIQTPISVRLALRAASWSTYDDNGVLIDGVTNLLMDEINAGSIAGSRTWSSSESFAGVQGDITIDFISNGKLLHGSTLQFQLPNTQWMMAQTFQPTILSPNIADVSLMGTFDVITRRIILTVNAPNGSQISSRTSLKILIPNVTNPPKETGITTAVLTTYASDGKVVDGPSDITVLPTSRGALRGKKTWISDLNAASRKSNHVLSFTLNGALPSGGSIRILLPSGEGWRFLKEAEIGINTVSFVTPSSGVITVAGVSYSTLDEELRILTNGDLAAGTAVELLIESMVTPYSASSATMLTVSTYLSDAVNSGIVDQSTDIQVNAITSPALDTTPTWTSSVATPGVISTHFLSLTTGGALEGGAKFCASLPVQDEWQVIIADAVGTIEFNGKVHELVLSWDALTRTVCFSTNTLTIPELTQVQIKLTNVETPQSIRSAKSGSIIIYSHLGGFVNTGDIDVNEINVGSFTGDQKWQSAFHAPGPVAGLETFASLTFQSTGRIGAGGKIVLNLPVTWVFLDECTVSFVKPSVLGEVTCNQQTMTVVLHDSIPQYSDIELVLTGIYNPPILQGTDFGTGSTIAVDGGLIDSSTVIVTSATESMLQNILSSGDTRVAVVGALKKFTFEGVSIDKNDAIKFVDWNSLRDANCGDYVPNDVSDVGGIDVILLPDTHEVELKFTQSSLLEKPFALCYKFGNNPFKLYRNFAFTVKEILSLEPVSGAANVAVANHAKTWKIIGNGPERDDQVRFVSTIAAIQDDGIVTNTDCENTDFLAKLLPNQAIP
jgi:hypothetical protein